MKHSGITRLVTKFRLLEVVAMETVAHFCFYSMTDISAGGQAIVLKHFSLSLVLLNLKWTKVQSHRT